MTQIERDTFLNGVRVLELADELGEYCGRVLAGLGADVVKVEPPGGEVTRGYGPYYKDEPHRDRSLYFWHYNLGKRGIIIDLDTPRGIEQFRQQAAAADVIIDTRPPNYLTDRGVGYEELSRINPGLVYVRISGFGDAGPWGGYTGSDLIHLALGGMVMNCGYDPDTTGKYETPPIAPQMWHAYHIAGENAAIQLIAALTYRTRSGEGQKLTLCIHDAVAKNTEADLPNWVYARQFHERRTCKHSFPVARSTAEALLQPGALLPGIARTQDGRWLLPYQTYLSETQHEQQLKVLKKFNAQLDLEDEKYQDREYQKLPSTSFHVNAVIETFIGRFAYNRDLWKVGQEGGLPWSPMRLPEENIDDPHWAARETFADIEYPELGIKIKQVVAKWYSASVPWPKMRRAPLLGEHNEEVLSQPAPKRAAPPKKPASAGGVVSAHGKPFALEGVRVVDLAWLLASGGAGRFFSAHGAEVIKIEHLSRIDVMRSAAGVVPPGGRAQRDAAGEPIWSAPGLNRSGQFSEINSGKRGFSLNLKDPRGKAILIELIKTADIIVEGFSPGTMDRMGLGYERLKEINPRIVYVQQSGMGQNGVYGQLRSFGPTAQAFSGLSEMSGLPNPYAPAGIGYSYLDWFGAYQMATAMMAALYRQRQTGRGCWIDSSQVETGLYLTGTAILDYSVNGRHWSRYGNRSPYKQAAPHGVYRTAGTDRWLAIASFTEAHWRSLVAVLGVPSWLSDSRFTTLADRMRHQDALDALVAEMTVHRDGYKLMETLQAAGVPAGVCQTAGDRYEIDPQLRFGKWLTEVRHSEIGTWPVKELSGVLSKTPAYIGGTVGRGGPCYGEDNDYVLGEILGMSAAQIAELAKQGVL